VVVRLPDPKLKTLGERGIECMFVEYAPRLLVPRPSLSIPKVTKDIGGSVVPEKVTEEVVQQPEPKLRKSKMNKTPKDFRPKFQLYSIEGTRDEVSDQHSYCFNVEDDPKTFDEVLGFRSFYNLFGSIPDLATTLNRLARSIKVWDLQVVSEPVEKLRKGWVMNLGMKINILEHTGLSYMGSHTEKEMVSRERERKARTTFLMALPEDHLAKFHKMTNSKEMWDAIKSRFGGNDESKKMQKYLLKHHVSLKGNQKFLRVFESDVKGSTGSSSTRILNSLMSLDLEEMQLEMQVARIFNEIEEVLQEDSKRRDAGNTGYREKDNGRRPRKQEEPKALVTLNGEGVDWTVCKG
ncbi:hypothetical protein Tco_1341978, partial [Tanacetum coccineum]